jgi:hypothetical protein
VAPAAAGLLVALLAQLQTSPHTHRKGVNPISPMITASTAILQLSTICSDQLGEEIFLECSLCLSVACISMCCAHAGERRTGDVCCLGCRGLQGGIPATRRTSCGRSGLAERCGQYGTTPATQCGLHLSVACTSVWPENRDFGVALGLSVACISMWPAS